MCCSNEGVSKMTIQAQTAEHSKPGATHPDGFLGVRGDSNPLIPKPKI